MDDIDYNDEKTGVAITRYMQHRWDQMTLAHNLRIMLAEFLLGVCLSLVDIKTAGPTYPETKLMAKSAKDYFGGLYSKATDLYALNVIRD
jgi:hypothetical protein